MASCKIGVTGTRSGMNEYQRKALHKLLLGIAALFEDKEFHHGDCVGVDIEAATIAKDLGFKIICHPPIKQELVGNFPSDEYREPLSYFARNRKIVDETSFLFVVPIQTEWTNHGGTWYTHDYAFKLGKAFSIVYPDRVENNV